MITAASWITYIAVGLYVYRRTWVAVYEADVRDFPLTYADRGMDAGDHFRFTIVSVVAGALWLFVIPVWVIYRFATPTTPSERKANLDAREREIRRLERDLGIKDRP